MRMIETGVTGVDFCAINTDMQALSRFGGICETVSIGMGLGMRMSMGMEIGISIFYVALTPIASHALGRDITRGLGAGGQPDNGRKAAEESRADIMKVVSGADLVFVTAGMC
ncbi:hypothetical protein EON63_01935 [archaeon]|nr:MAG: hypothetical protein EON63_01935 [archaeon]